jgi:FtsP/CotA-like multicopper oxidase with cupredoxin domain
MTDDTTPTKPNPSDVAGARPAWIESRRSLLRAGAGAAAIGAILATGSRRAAAATTLAENEEDLPPGVAGRDYRPVITPDSVTLPHRVVDGVKVFHLIAQPVLHRFAAGLEAECFGFNGRVHGPTIEAVEGDRVRIYVTNRLDTATSVHWHGLFVPNGMDGVGGLNQRAIEPGETFRYEFTLRQHGTYMYHSHHDEMTQMALGLMGLFVIHPRHPESLPTPPPDRDYAYLLSEWSIPPGSRRPDPNEMTDFNVLTLNAKIFPATSPMLAKTGERVRIRIGNLSAMDHHPMHIHGHAFTVTETDGGVIPESARWREVTVLVPVGSTRTVEFVADNPGDWAFHCHMTHHVMTQMGHGIPNLIGVDPSAFDAAIADHVPQFLPADASGGHGAMSAAIPENSMPMMGGAGPFGYITMGGMFSILKVRDELEGEGDPGWYRHPAGTVADRATRDELDRDGIP